jgi:hypothetical protein
MQNDFLLAICASVKAGTRICLYAFKLKSSLIASNTVFCEHPSSLEIFLADFLFLFWHKFLLILAIKDFVRTVLGRPGEVLDDIPFLVIRATHLYTVALETVLLSIL